MIFTIYRGWQQLPPRKKYGRCRRDPNTTPACVGPQEPPSRTLPRSGFPQGESGVAGRRGAPCPRPLQASVVTPRTRRGKARPSKKPGFLWLFARGPGPVTVARLAYLAWVAAQTTDARAHFLQRKRRPQRIGKHRPAVL